MRLLGVEELVQLADLAVGGRADIRDLGLLASAAARPGAGFGDFEAYPNLVEKPAALMHSLVRNHALVDGNKRLGWVATVVLLDLNGVQIEVEDDEAYDVVISVVEGTLDFPELAALLQRWADAAGQ